MPKFLNCFLTAVICSSTVLTSIYANTSPSFSYGTDKILGVNLGGWLVLEPWITPSIFDNTGDNRIVDEYTFGQYQDHKKALSALTKHWDTWITELDFEKIAAAGLNHVRIPIGYWAFEVSGGEPYVQGQLPYLAKAIYWAECHGLKVIVDLHGAPGSQNGFDNSGQRLSFPQWQTKKSYIERTGKIIKTLAKEYKDNSVVTVLAPLNEPAGFDGQQILDVTKQYWRDSYNSIRHPSGISKESNTIVMIHDAFQPVSYWDGFMPAPQYNGVFLDTHIYQVFTDEVKLNLTQHIKTACGRKTDLTASQLPLVVGEWSPAATDCAKYLNGRLIGSRYDGTYPKSTFIGSCKGFSGKASTFSTRYKTFLRQYWEAQAITYGKTQGWIQWTWKTEMADEWSYQAGLDYGWIPQDPTDYKYPDICG